DQRDYRGAPDAQPSFARYQRKVDRVRLDARSRFEHGRAIGALLGTGGWAETRASFGAGPTGLALSACHPGRCQGTADDCHHETKVLVHGSRKPKDGSQVLRSAGGGSSLSNGSTAPGALIWRTCAAAARSTLRSGGPIATREALMARPL